MPSKRLSLSEAKVHAADKAPRVSPALSKVPRYRSIADELIGGIIGKQFPVGTALPAEAELCSRFDASRHTVREALRILEEGGLIVRRQGSGSEVLADTPPVRFRQTVDSIEDLLQYGKQSRLQLLSTRETAVEGALAARLGCRSGSVCVEISALRSEREAPGRAFALTQVWFPPQPARRRDKLLAPDTALQTLLAALDARSLGRIEQSFTAVALDGPAARHLSTHKGAPTLCADRAYFDRRGELIAVAKSLHRSDLFRYSTVLRHETD